jgi:hypothetical protein
LDNTSSWDSHLFVEGCGDSVDRTYHPKHDIVGHETEASVRLWLTADKPDEGGAGDVEPGGKLTVLSEINLRKQDGWVGAKGVDLRNGICKLRS